MKRICSLQLDLVPVNNQWAWRLFHRKANENASIAQLFPMPDNPVAEEITESLHAAVRLSDEQTLREWSNNATKKLLPAAIINELEKYSSGDVLFMVTEEWAEAPFELLQVSGDFLCNRFIIGTIINAFREQETIVKQYSKQASMLIITGPADDIPVSYNEATGLRAYARECGKDVRFIATSDKQKISDAMERAAIVHFAGHSVYTGEKEKSGWKLNGQELLDIMSLERLASGGAVPWLVFSNSCNAGNSGCSKELAGIAGAFLRMGVMQMIGPIAAISDSEAGSFSRGFYECLFKGKSCAEALFTARKRMREDCPSSITPLIYKLYGDPCFITQSERRVTEKNAGVDTVRKPKALAIVLAALLILCIVLFFLLPLGNGSMIYVPPR